MSDLDISTVVVFIVFFVLGGAAIGVGIFMRFRPLSFQNVRWYAQLVAWDVVNGNGYKPLLMQDVIRLYYRIQSSSVIGLGSAVILYLLITGVVINLLGKSADTILFASQVFFAGFYFFMVVGSSIGFMLGVWQTRMSAIEHSTTYGDLRRRQLSDYRASLFRVFPIVLILCTALLTYILFPYLGSTIQLGFPTSNSNGYFTNPVLVLTILPITMLFVLVVMEIMMVRITNLSRFRVTYDPIAGQHADDMLRATTIGMVQGYEFVIIGLLSLVQWDIIERNLWNIHFWHIGNRPFSSLFDALFFLALLIQISGFLIPLLQGRLGGKVSRWPWQRKLVF